MIKIVFVQFNAKNLDRKKEKEKDHVASKEMSKAVDWIVRDADSDNRHELLPGSDLTWGLVDQAMGTKEALQPRGSSRNIPNVGSSLAAVEALDDMEFSTRIAKAKKKKMITT